MMINIFEMLIEIVILGNEANIYFEILVSIFVLAFVFHISVLSKFVIVGLL